MKINDLIKSISQDMQLNNRVFYKDDFYYMLKYVGIKKNNYLYKDIDKFYEEFLTSLNNSLVRYETRSLKFGENKTNYISFYATEKADYLKAVKVYFPVKYEYLISSLKTVFLYLIRNNIKSTVKFHLKATNEAIVIRFYDEKDVMPFINYCNQSFILKELLEKTNPFIPTIYGIGVVRDDNTKYSYLAMLSECLQDYFWLLKNTNTLDRASDLDFLDYLIKRANIEEDDKTRFDINEIQKGITNILNLSNPLE